MILPVAPSIQTRTRSVATPTLPSWATALALATALVCGTAHAVDSFTLKDIRVEGLQRTDAGTVFANLPFRIGDTYNDDKGAAALRALFATGLFRDVRIEIDGNTVVVVIDERPVIAAVSFTGLKEFDTEALTKSLKEVGIGEGLPFDKALADRAEQELKRQYLTRSLYGAEVVTTITPLERNRVNVSFNVVEGDPAKIRRVHITGNKVFSEGTLTDLFEQSASGWLSFYTKNDRYARSKLNADLEALRSYYLNRGYLEFAVESTQVTISPDKQSIDINIAVHEGQPYVVTAVKLEGDYLGHVDDFKSLTGAIKPGEPYRGEVVAQTAKFFTDLFGAYGYAFARVEPRTDIDRATGQVVVALVADPSRRVYVRRVNVAGNTKTRDEVIRREFRQFESSWYDGGRIKLSRDRVERLGYFKEVTVDTAEVAGAPDQVDITITVTEKPTGSFMIGAGYSTADSLSFTASVTQDNIFGSGNYLAFQLNTGRTGRTIQITALDPYFTADGVSRWVDLAYRTVKPLNTLGETYELQIPSAAVRFGVPFTDFDTVYFGIGIEQTTIKSGSTLPNNYYIQKELYGDSSKSLPLTIGWQRDSRDSALSPTAGRFARVNLEWSPTFESRYTRANMQYTQYVQLPKRFSVGLNAELGYGAGYAGRPYPASKNFYGGGLGSVRVFEPGSLGPVDVLGTYAGGNRKVNLNGEFYIPLPGLGSDKSLRFFGFLDAGNVWGQYDSVTASSLRSSYGIGMNWQSPMGPLQMVWGLPLRKQPTDRIERFQFKIGTAF